MSNKGDDLKVAYQALRIGVVMCFIGHGAFGIITKHVWCNYFAVFGIGPGLAYRFMPVIGFLDISLGVIMLLYPTRAVAVWLVFWGAMTALLRPLSGEPVAELIERAGNFGTPLMLLCLTGCHWKRAKEGFARIRFNTTVAEKNLNAVYHGLQVVSLLLLTGHGWLFLIGKNGLIDQVHSLHIENASAVASVLGIMEISAALFIFLRPVRSVILAVLLWKIASELFYPHYELLEWIERGGSYACLFSLWIVRYNLKDQPFHFSRKPRPPQIIGHPS